MANILMVVTAAQSLTLSDGSEHPTGFWAEELVVAHRELTAAGHRVHVATPGGARPTVDPGSLLASNVGSEDAATELSSYLTAIAEELNTPFSLADIDHTKYQAIVLPGGHGPMADLATDSHLGKLLTAANDESTIIAPFCHGPAGLLSATTAEGAFAFSGRRLTVFTDEEELTGGLRTKTPWFVESTLREAGATIDSGPAWTSHVIRDGNLISGQNPQSSLAVAETLLDALT